MSFDEVVRTAGVEVAQAFSPARPYAAIFSRNGVVAVRLDEAEEYGMAMHHWEQAVSYRIPGDATSLRRLEGGEIAGHELAGPEDVDPWFRNGGRLAA